MSITDIDRAFDEETTHATAVDKTIAQARAKDTCNQCENVGGFERVVSAVVGGSLIAGGLSRRSGWGASVALAGAGFLHRALTGRCYLYQTLGINTAQGRNEQLHNYAVGVPAKRGRKYETSILVSCPAEHLFDYWRNLHHLPRLFAHLISVVELQDGRSHWLARGPLSQRVEWNAEVYNQRLDKMIAWRSIPGSDLDTAGSIHFEGTADGRTIVTLNMKYNPPAGEVGAAIADWLGQSVDEELDEGLRRLKQIAEAGEVPTVAGQSRGTCGKT